MKRISFSELTLKDLTFKSLMVVIRYILLSILFVSIYLVIWYFIYKIGNKNIIVWGAIICLSIGCYKLEEYEDRVTANIYRRSIEEEGVILDVFEIDIFLKIIIIPIVIPLMISAYVCDFISAYIYKNNARYGLSNYNSTTYDYSDFEEEYYCEICLKRITEEDYELYDCMCKDCFLKKEDNNNMEK